MATSFDQHLSKIKSPLGGEKVYKDECAFSFDTPECDTGLYICMNSFIGLGKNHVENYFRKTGNAVFLHLRRIKKELPQPEESENSDKPKPTKLAIGVEGGFDVDDKKFEFEDQNSVVVLPDWTVYQLTDPSLPGVIQISAASIVSVDSASKQEEAAALASSWEETRVISKHAENLPQLDNGKKIPPSGWKCEMCDKVDNLWLNLTDGSILCGRKFWDGTGGNNHALEHYSQVKHPLAVKLGTITPNGGDVFSYDEDDMVEDPYLAKHLEHWGIDIMKMEKTDKSMAELEIDLNQKFAEWDVITEAGSKLEPVHGAGLTGIRNLGNSCYMNSVMQVLFSIPDFRQRYFDSYGNMIDKSARDAAGDFNVQMSKFAFGLLSGDYSCPQPPEPEDKTQARIVKPVGIRPLMFKSLVGRGHPEFSTKRQQDAQEYLLHLFSLIERNSVGTVNPTDCFKFDVETRLECVQSKKVKYRSRSEFILPLPVDMEAATNMTAVAEFEQKKKELEAAKQVVDPKDVVRPKIPLQACLDKFAAPEFIDNFYSTALKAPSVAKQISRMATFPDYLLIHMKKFTVGADWVPKKLDVSMEMPDELDLAALRAKGLQPGEEELPEEQGSGDQQPAVNIDENIVAQLADMGFDINGCRKAVYNTQSAGIEPAMNWVMEHMGDPDFAVPLDLGGPKKSGSFTPSEDGLAMIMSMGFSRDQAVKALKNTDNNVERAADWIFSHPEELDTPMEADPPAESAASRSTCRDGNSKYTLVGFISHMGTSTHVGHYVCHIVKDGKWVIFNDEKVALSENPPKDLAYIYLYKRI